MSVNTDLCIILLILIKGKWKVINGVNFPTNNQFQNTFVSQENLAIFAVSLRRERKENGLKTYYFSYS